jgi:hypothetical protein
MRDETAHEWGTRHWGKQVPFDFAQGRLSLRLPHRLRLRGPSHPKDVDLSLGTPTTRSVQDDKALEFVVSHSCRKDKGAA